MMAQGVKDDSHLERLLNDSSYAAQEKLDGMRAIIHITNKGIRVFSRSAGVGDPTRPLEKTGSLPHLVSLEFPQLVGTILDAEILVPGVDSASLAGAIHSKESSGVNGLVKAFVFDVVAYCKDDLHARPLRDRYRYLEFTRTRLHSPHFDFLSWAFSTIEKKRLHRQVIKNGGEGIMLKNLDSTYAIGSRPANCWYKAKKSMTIDAVVIGFSKGKGKFNEQIGAVRFGQYIDGELVELGQASGMTDIERSEMSEYPSRYLGKVVRIKGMERLKSGAIRHPVYAGLNRDKDPRQCIWYQGEQ